MNEPTWYLHQSLRHDWGYKAAVVTAKLRSDSLVIAGVCFRGHDLAKLMQLCKEAGAMTYKPSKHPTYTTSAY